MTVKGESTADPKGTLKFPAILQNRRLAAVKLDRVIGGS